MPPQQCDKRYARREMGLLTSFDLNYRGKLWSAEQVRRTVEPLLADVDLVIGNEEDAAKVLGIVAGHTDVTAGQLTAPRTNKLRGRFVSGIRSAGSRSPYASRKVPPSIIGRPACWTTPAFISAGAIRFR